MIDSRQANDIAGKYVAGIPFNSSSGDRLVILHDATIEKPCGWIFFYTSKQWHETGEFRFAVAGNAPLLVTRDAGEIKVFGTARSVDWYIEQYELGLS